MAETACAVQSIYASAPTQSGIGKDAGGVLSWRAPFTFPSAGASLVSHDSAPTPQCTVWPYVIPSGRYVRPAPYPLKTAAETSA